MRGVKAAFWVCVSWHQHLHLKSFEAFLVLFLVPSRTLRHPMGAGISTSSVASQTKT